MKAALLALVLAGCASAIPAPVPAPSVPMLRAKAMCQAGQIVGIRLATDQSGYWELSLDDVDELAKVCESGI